MECLNACKHGFALRAMFKNVKQVPESPRKFHDKGKKGRARGAALDEQPVQSAEPYLHSERGNILAADVLHARSEHSDGNILAADVLHRKCTL